MIEGDSSLSDKLSTIEIRKIIHIKMQHVLHFDTISVFQLSPTDTE